MGARSLLGVGSVFWFRVPFALATHVQLHPLPSAAGPDPAQPGRVQAAAEARQQAEGFEPVAAARTRGATAAEPATATALLAGSGSAHSAHLSSTSTRATDESGSAQQEPGASSGCAEGSGCPRREGDAHGGAAAAAREPPTPVVPVGTETRPRAASRVSRQPSQGGQSRGTTATDPASIG
jgi:hypothetical protein